MSDQTGISWCDSTFNPWIGKPRKRTGAANWKLPAKWDKAEFVQCQICGWRGGWNDADDRQGRCPSCNYLPERFRPVRRRVFCAALADWLDNEVPIEWLVDLLDLIRRTPNLDWLLLTKRIGNFRNRMRSAALQAACDVVTPGSLPTMQFVGNWLDGIAPPNVWIGATICNQAEADRDVLKLLSVPARVRFLSIGPMLGPIYIEDMPDPVLGGGLKPLAGLRWRRDGNGRCEPIATPGRIDWVICGGESGPYARPMHPDWVRSLRDQCAAAEVPFYFKQFGKAASGRSLDGIEHAGFPRTQP